MKPLSALALLLALASACAAPPAPAAPAPPVPTVPPPSFTPRGLAAEQVRSVVASADSKLRACYTVRGSSSAGTVTIGWKINASGQVDSATLVDTSLNDPRMEGCLLRVVRSLVFPSSPDGFPTTVGSYPLRFGLGG